VILENHTHIQKFNSNLNSFEIGDHKHTYAFALEQNTQYN